MNRSTAEGWLGKLVAITFSLLLLLAVEGVARILVSETHLDSILKILTQDQNLFWRQKSNLDTSFAGKIVKTNSSGLRISANDKPAKSKSALKIVCLGASPTFGWGVGYKNSYPAIVEKLLATKLKREVHVLNAGMIGYTSHQGLKLFKNEILDLKPDIITVSYVLNDLDKYRFFQSNGKPDKELKIPSGFLIAARNLLSHSEFFKVLEKGIHYLLGRRATLGSKSLEIHPPQSVRVSHADYRQNLEDIIQLARQNNIKVILIKMPVNLPKLSLLSGDIIQKAQHLHDNAVKLISKGFWKKAQADLKQAIIINQEFSSAYYYLGICERHNGHEAKANEYLKLAMRSEAKRCGSEGKNYNRIMGEVAQSKSVILADVVTAFENHPDKYLFVDKKADPIHPNAEGHEIIGQLIAEIVESQ